MMQSCTGVSAMACARDKSGLTQVREGRCCGSGHFACARLMHRHERTDAAMPSSADTLQVRYSAIYTHIYISVDAFTPRCSCAQSRTPALCCPKCVYLYLIGAAGVCEANVPNESFPEAWQVQSPRKLDFPFAALVAVLVSVGAACYRVM